MTEVKMPEPAGTICFDGGRWEENWVSSESAYSDDQLKQYGDDRAREALEMAAKECESSLEEHKLHSNFICAMAIRALAKEIQQ